MKKYIILIIAFLFSALCLNVFGQTKQFPFEVLKTGNGDQSIIFIPGFASSGDVWNETRATFENKFTCYTLTMAGFAGSKPQPNASFENWKTGIANYIKENKIEKPIIIGHSMGGGLALAIAADYPDLIGKIVIVDALPCLAAMTDPAFKSKENNDCSPMVAQMTAMNETQFYEMQKQTMPRLLEDKSKLEMVVDWSVKSDRATFGQMFCDFYNVDLRNRIAQIKCPALILLESYFINLKPTIEDQYKNLKTANFQYATNGLHFIMYDDTAWYLEQLSIFLK
ncbi:alpha/beta fold hydrolase [Flavobacterium ginsenosidimutans]|uniref:Alpha/beta hydrolase n=1 Tax=Flavobacterium ginsenosidimutans TaxID=687844 RepID=A0ABZ2QD16_9FLAO|nr:alpha/beta hydrolase [Flavobacterium ginsenosidimutans]KAF2331046.1 alpha/beta hydrolase [Flavobacterium ginsenosidimutans]